MRTSSNVTRTVFVLDPSTVLKSLILNYNITDLPHVLRYSTTFFCEFVFATRRAVLPFLDWAFASAPCSTRYWTQRRWPFLAAEWRGVYPVTSGWLISPPLLTNSLTTSKWPLAAALWRAVVPVSSGSVEFWTINFS